MLNSGSNRILAVAKKSVSQNASLANIEKPLMVDVGVQVSLHPFEDVEERQHNYFAAWFQRPHTVTVLCISLAIIWVASQISYSHVGPREDSIRGLIAAIFIFLVFATLQVPDGIMVRPSRWFWRCAMGCSVLYLILFVFLLFQDLNVVRQALAVIDPALGVPLKERNYAENCNSWSTFRAQLDLFVPAHLFGWLVKALIVRDAKLLWFLSLLYEWMEITYRHILPNFWECWWDHLILDIFGCNFFGIIIGMKLCRVFNLKPFDWKVSPPILELPARKDSSILSFTFWVNLIRSMKDIPFLNDFRAFSTFSFLTVIFTLVDLNLFFLKAELWIDTSHWIILVRTVFWGVVSAAGVREFYEYMLDKDCDRMGVQCWLVLAMTLTECLLVCKWNTGLQTRYPRPLWIAWIWWVAFILYAIASLRIWNESRKTKHQ